MTICTFSTGTHGKLYNDLQGIYFLASIPHFGSSLGNLVGRFTKYFLFTETIAVKMRRPQFSAFGSSFFIHHFFFNC
jgi:hypothetical protein